MRPRLQASEKELNVTDRWLKSDEAARYMGVEVTTLAKWRHQGAGPPYSCALGRDPRYRLSLLEAFMADALVSNSTEARSVRRSHKQCRLAASF